MAFITDDFLLQNETAKELYHGAAKDCKIIDFHCHLDAQLILDDYSFKDATELFLGGDHYKWRLMRTHGIDEKYITGNAQSIEKWRAFAAAMPYAIGNPIYHWTHLELSRYFGIEEILCPKTADAIYERIGASPLRARAFIEKSNVSAICTTNDPTEDLAAHKGLRGFSARVLPTFRPDRAIEIEKPDFLEYIERLGAVAYADLVQKIADRIEYFASVGALMADHSLGVCVYAQGDAEAVFNKRRRGEALTPHEIEIYKTAMLQVCAREYSKRSMTMQLHIGALRNNNSKMFAQLGADSGFDSMNDEVAAQKLSRLLDSFEKDSCLPKTVLYCLNPRDNATLASMAGNFQGGGVRSKVQFGSAWWFCDHRDGMEAQLKALAALGVLGDFIGMLTDSRSFVSYTRHEYFRRILCNLIGTWVENGEYPRDEAMLKTLVRGICHDNAKE